MINLEEKIYAWKPIEGLEGKFHVRSATFDLEGFRIVLFKDGNPKKGVLLDFSGGVESYRISEELLSMHLLESSVIPYEGYILPKEGEKPSAWCFFKVENSEYLKWASYQSDTVSEHIGLVHYAIWSRDWTIDVLSLGEPRVEFIDISD